jgi:hypothetical protein
MTCQRGSMAGNFARVIANSTPKPIPVCLDGAGASSKMTEGIITNMAIPTECPAGFPVRLLETELGLCWYL